MLEIKNDELTVKINELGAELTSVYGNNNVEYIWDNDAWPKHAPILFPAIGRSVDDSYLVNGKEYHMDQHGFAANQKFEVVDNKKNSVTLKLTDNEETLSSYPYKFELIVNYSLNGKKLITNFKINNLDSKKLSFSLGFHPAFNIPIEKDEKFEDYSLNFSPEQENLKQFEIIKTPFPYRSGNVIDFNEKNNFCLNRKLFDKGLIIFKNEFNEVSLSSKKHNIHVDMSNFSNLCIEPFYGLPDVANNKQELLEKEGNVVLKENESKYLNCTVEFN